jgi:sulfite exporter TauE/SafE
MGEIIAATPGPRRRSGGAKGVAMGVGTSIFLIAIGAILDFAISVNTRGFNLHGIGVILMVVGALGLVVSLFFWNSWGGFGGGRTTVVEEGGPRRRVVEEEIR